MTPIRIKTPTSYFHPTCFSYYSPTFQSNESFSTEGIDSPTSTLRPWDMDTLKAALETSVPGTGATKQIIKNCSCKLRAQAFTKLINTCGRFRQWEKAVEIFEAMKEYPGVSYNTYTYSALISACSNSGRFDEALHYFEKMKENALQDAQCVPNMITYRSIISTCERFGKYDKVLELYDESLDAGIVPDKNTFAAAFDAAQHVDRWDRAETIIEEMHENKILPSMVMYINLIRHYILKSEWQRALDLIEDIEDNKGGICINKALRDTMSIPLKDYDQVLVLIQSLWDSGIVLDLNSYNAILQVIANAGWWQTSLKILKVMEDENLCPNIDTADIVIKAALLAGKKSIAKKLAMKFIASGIQIYNFEDCLSPREARSC